MERSDSATWRCSRCQGSARCFVEGLEAHGAGYSCVGSNELGVWASACRACGELELSVFEPTDCGRVGEPCRACGLATRRVGELNFEGAAHLYAVRDDAVPCADVCNHCLTLTLREREFPCEGLLAAQSAMGVHLRGHWIVARSEGGLCRLHVEDPSTLGDDDVPGLGCIEDWLDAAEQAELLGHIDAAPWSDVLARRVQHYGWRYAYKRRSVAPEDELGPLPDWAERLAARLADEFVFDTAPEQLIVNEYQPGQGIAAHVDAPGFGPVVASISLGSAVVMRLRFDGHVHELTLPPGSLLKLAGPARNLWTHEIPKRRSDPGVHGRVIRGRRVSLTFRTIRA